MDTEQRDLDLLTRFAGGDREALGALAEQHEHSMLGLACGWLGGDASLARDAVQNTWVRIIRHAKSFKGNSSVKTWMYRILLNCCHDLRQRQKRDGGRTTCEPADPSLATHERSPCDAHEDAQRLMSAMQELDTDRRDAVLLCFHTGITQQQAAEILSVPVGTLKSRVRTGMAELRQMLAKVEQ